MKNRLLIILILVLAIPCLANAERLRIAIIDLECTGGISDRYQKAFSDRLRNELLRTGKYKVYERADMDKILKEQGLQQVGITRENAAIIGELLSVDYLILGSVAKVGLTYSINLRMISVKTGEIIIAKSLDCGENLEEIITQDIPAIARYLAYNISPSTISIGYSMGDIPLNIKGFHEIDKWLLDHEQSDYALPGDKDVVSFNGIHLETHNRSNGYFLIELGEVPMKHANLYFLNIGGGGKKYLIERYARYAAPCIFFEVTAYLFLFDLNDFPSEIEYDTSPYVDDKTVEKSDTPGTVGFSLNTGGELKIMQRAVIQLKFGYFWALETPILKQKDTEADSPLEAIIGGSGITTSLTISLAL